MLSLLTACHLWQSFIAIQAEQRLRDASDKEVDLGKQVAGLQQAQPAAEAVQTR